MLTRTPRPATAGEQQVREIILKDWSPASAPLAILDFMLGISFWYSAAALILTGVGAGHALYPKNPTGQFLLLLTCIGLLLLGRFYWHRLIQPRLSRPPSDRLHPTASTPTTVDQWLCIAYKYYYWDVTGDMPTLLALTRDGDLLLVQSQALDVWTNSDEPGPIKLGSICRYETIQGGPITLAFEGTPVPVEELDERHPAAGVMSLELSLIRVPRRTFEALARTTASRT